MRINTQGALEIEKLEGSHAKGSKGSR